ncbi:MAG: energy transducer TonB [Myxococcaceae bacterium]|jgi:TonB family protein|nr:energy transducer TonB [Myxococcaceae bacterium]MCA3012126.1 energy transducer TonB [Myxococcaceae bacterium]
MRLLRRQLAAVLFVLAPATGAGATEAGVGALARTLGYDEGLSRRLTREPVVVLSVGVPCAAWPAETRVAGHLTRCEQGALGPGLVADAAARKALLLLGDLDPGPAASVVAQAREALVPVVGVGRAHASTDVLLAIDGAHLFVGEQAAKRLGAKFPAAVLKLATIVAGPEGDIEPLVREVSSTGSYPDEALNAGVEGPVALRITIDESGRVTDAVVTRGLGFGLDEEAVRRIKRFTFSPARRGGRPVPATIDYTVRFALQD